MVGVQRGVSLSLWASTASALEVGVPRRPFDWRLVYQSQERAGFTLMLIAECVRCAHDYRYAADFTSTRVQSGIVRATGPTRCARRRRRPRAPWRR